MCVTIYSQGGAHVAVFVDLAFLGVRLWGLDI